MPRLLDLFCGAGGAAMGYHRAGFDEIVGVDIRPQPRYPFEFNQCDIMEVGVERIVRIFGPFDMIHASPPCQGYSSMRHLTRARLAKWGREPRDYPKLLQPIREQLTSAAIAYVIENVVGAPMRRDAMLCGSMFGLRVRRHRLFELSIGPCLQPQCQHDRDDYIGVYGRKGGGRRLWSRKESRAHVNGWGAYTRSELRAAKSTADAADAMGIDWMEWDEIREAIPPAYTELLGRQMIASMAASA